MHVLVSAADQASKIGKQSIGVHRPGFAIVGMHRPAAEFCSCGPANPDTLTQPSLTLSSSPRNTKRSPARSTDPVRLSTMHPPLHPSPLSLGPQDELIGRAREIYAALDLRLGNSTDGGGPFFFGAEPTSLDACVFGHLAEAWTLAGLLDLLPAFENLSR